jgi:AcrR family transcriptional regulator
MPREGETARTALVDAGERLFAVHGVETASLRDIAVAAGHRNNSAVQYHFGGRDGLAAAVYSRGMGPINRVRIGMLEQAGTDTVHGLVSVLLVPLAAHVEESAGWYGRFLARNRFDRVAREVRDALPESEVLRQVTRRLGRLLDGVPPAVRAARMEQMVNHYVTSLASWEWARDRGERKLSAADLRDDLVVTCAAMVGADLGTKSGHRRTR